MKQEWMVCALCVCAACSAEQAQAPQEQLNEDEGQPDVWYGPGFYYGIWFEQEDEYWGWRNEHPDYPANHQYYHHDHPVHYDQGDRGRGERRGGGRGGHGGGHR